MADTEKSKVQADADALAASSGPLVFISHDSRDGELAEAFSKLLKSVSSSMIKTFRSSDKKGSEGIDFGDEWYKRLMTALQSTSDVVCLFTERSLDRPWILFEAGVAKGKLDTPVIGLALGVPLNRISTGPFYQFQNMDDSEGDLAKLINQVAKRIPGLEPDTDVIKTQVANFKTSASAILKKIGTPEVRKERKEMPDESSVAKIVEEMKSLPSRVAERLMGSDELFSRRRRLRKFHPMVFERLMDVDDGPGDPVAILIAASLVRDDIPWMYELAMEVYRAVKSGNPVAMEAEIARLGRIFEFMPAGPFLDELVGGDIEAQMLTRKFPRMLQHMLSRAIQVGKSDSVRRRVRHDANKA